MNSLLHYLTKYSKVVETLGLSYSTSSELYNIIDKLPGGTPPFNSDALVMGGEDLKLNHRDIILCVRSLFGNPEFAQDLIFAPERHYTNAERTSQIYNEMHTGD